MLPGLRFVVATIVLAVSLVVFALGAAALLRASHEQFANLPPAQAPREPFTLREPETRQPVLAALRVDPPADQPAPVVAMPTPAVQVIDVDVGVVPSDRGEGISVSADAEAHVDAPPAIEVAAREIVQDAAPPAVVATKAATPSAVPEISGCLPASNALPTAQTFAQLAALIDLTPQRPNPALLPALQVQAAAVKPAVRHARRTRHRHHFVRLHRPRVVIRQPQPNTAYAAQQTQSYDPFAAFPASTTRQR